MRFYLGDHLKLNTMLNWCVSLLVVISFNSSFANSYPVEPDPQRTPGTLCDDPDEYRYPEKIPYCNRKVSKSQKNNIIDDYEKAFDFSVEKLGRDNFKIDHLIPLCAGGSNHDSNLWPQYKAIFESTDPIEGLLCQKMADGLLKQKDAIALVLDVKHYRKPVEEAMNFLKSLQKKK